VNPYRFSIIIPTHDRPEQLTECLTAIRRLDFPKDALEIIVVDDGSRVPVKERIGEKEGLQDIRWIRIPNSGPAAARNRGAMASNGDYLVFIDDDCIPSSDWLANVAHCATLYPDCLIGGRTLNRLVHSPYSTTSQIILDAAYRFYNATPLFARFLTSNNMTVRADLFTRVGGFNEGFRIASEDREFCDRWIHQDRQIVFCEEIVIFHHHRLTLESFCRQHFNYGRGAFQYHSLRHKRGSGSIKADMRFHTRLGSLLKNPLMKMNRSMAVKVYALLALWQIVNLFGFLYQGSTSRN
jgi:GT2 family glycosyltransferase